MSPSALMVLAGVVTVLSQGVTRPPRAVSEELAHQAGAAAQLGDASQAAGPAELSPPLLGGQSPPLQGGQSPPLQGGHVTEAGQERTAAERSRKEAERTEGSGRRRVAGPEQATARTVHNTAERTNDSGHVSARDGYGTSGYGGGGSPLETALLTLAFLTFAVFVIQNLQNIIMLLTGGAGGMGRSAPAPFSSLLDQQLDDSRLYDLDMAAEVTHQFMAALYKYSHP